jgi:hypothetical protein
MPNQSSMNIAGLIDHWNHVVLSVFSSIQVVCASGNSFAQPPTMPAS